MTGYSECMVRRVAASEMRGCQKLVCANVYGLCWSESLLARMECAALFSPLVIQSRETSSGYGFGERRVRPLCHLLIRQQTWQETIISRESLSCSYISQHGRPI